LDRSDLLAQGHPCSSSAGTELAGRSKSCALVVAGTPLQPTSEIIVLDFSPNTIIMSSIFNFPPNYLAVA
jgi:hypothetical protein